MQKYELPEDLAQGLINYLASKPYIEVEGLIRALRERCPPIPLVAEGKASQDANAS